MKPVAPPAAYAAVGGFANREIAWCAIAKILK